MQVLSIGLVTIELTSLQSIHRSDNGPIDDLVCTACSANNTYNHQKEKMHLSLNVTGIRKVLEVGSLGPINSDARQV